jgi:O-antigen/teichoic acid export membrane protein
MRQLIRFGGHLTASQLLWLVYSQSDTIICGRLLGKDMLGIYSVAMHLAAMPIQRMAHLINRIAFPAFARLQHDMAKVRETVLAGTRMLSAIGFAVLWGISSVTPEIVEVILGPKWSAVSLPLELVALVMPIRLVSLYLPNAIQGLGRSDILLTNTIWSLFIGPPLFFLGAYHGGVVGLVVAWLVASPLAFVQSMSRSLPAIGLSLGQLLRAMLPATLAGLVMYIIVATTRNFLPMQPGVVRLVALIFAGVVGYATASWLLNRQGIAELRRFAVLVLRGDKPRPTEPPP